MLHHSRTAVLAEKTIGLIVNSISLNSVESLDARARIPTLASFVSELAPSARGPLSPLMAIVPGPTRIIRSSISTNWEGFILERHFSSPGERSSTVIDRHVVSMLCCDSSQFDYRLGNGQLARFSERSGSVTFTPAGPVPYVRLETAAKFIHCAFQESFIRDVGEEMGYRASAKPAFRSGIHDRSIQRILLLLAEELEAKWPLGRLYVDSLAHALAIRYLLVDDVCPVTDSYTSALPPRMLRRVKEKIEANLHMDLSLDSLARESGYSRAHFLRMFRAATGFTPHQFILDLRLKRAQDRIRQTNDSLIDIAALCGFSSQSHMTTIFRRHLDMTPAQFRRNLTSGEPLG